MVGCPEQVHKHHQDTFAVVVEDAVGCPEEVRSHYQDRSVVVVDVDSDRRCIPTVAVVVSDARYLGCSSISSHASGYIGRNSLVQTDHH